MTRHRFDGLSFLFGALFLLFGLTLLSGGATGLGLEWAGPLAAVVLSLVLVLAAWSSRPRAETSRPSEPSVDDPVPDA